MKKKKKKKQRWKITKGKREQKGATGIEGAAEKRGGEKKRKRLRESQDFDQGCVDRRVVAVVR